MCGNLVENFQESYKAVEISSLLVLEIREVESGNTGFRRVFPRSWKYLKRAGAVQAVDRPLRGREWVD